VTAAAALDLAAEVADAHAAASLAAADHIDVSFSSGGLAFTAKRLPDALARVEARLSPGPPADHPYRHDAETVDG
jgi:hypothetical protein